MGKPNHPGLQNVVKKIKTRNLRFSFLDTYHFEVGSPPPGICLLIIYLAYFYPILLPVLKQAPRGTTKQTIQLQ